MSLLFEKSWNSQTRAQEIFSHFFKMSQLCSFIKNSKIQFFSNPKQFHLSVGNKACDLDSMVSALSFAYYNSLVEPEKKCIGLIPIPIEEFRLR